MPSFPRSRFVPRSWFVSVRPYFTDNYINHVMIFACQAHGCDLGAFLFERRPVPRSHQVTWGRHFLSITSYRKEIQTRAWSHRVPFVTRHRMICVLPVSTQLGFEVTWPEINFYPWPLEIRHKSFDVSWREEHDFVRIFALAHIQELPKTLKSGIIGFLLSRHCTAWAVSVPTTAWGGWGIGSDPSYLENQLSYRSRPGGIR